MIGMADLFRIEDFDKQEWASFHDVVFEATGKSMGMEELKEIFNSLSHHTKMTAFEWGLSDTVFRDDAYTEIIKVNN
jgi:hypothetical protein